MKNENEGYHPKGDFASLGAGSCAAFINGFSQLSAGRTKQTTTRYAGARQKLYKKSPI